MDLTEALEAANVEWRPGKNDDEIYINCPFCTDTRFRLGVNILTGMAHCFNDGCEWKSYGESTFKKLQEAIDTGDVEAKEGNRKRHKRMNGKVVLPEGFRLLNIDDDSHWGKKAWKFVRNRGVSRDQIKHKKIGYTVIGSFAYRVIFPLYKSGILVGLVGRDFTGEQEPKYKNSTGAKYIYNLPEKQHSTICLSEGAFDTLAIETVAKKRSIDSGGLLGHSITDEQLHLLRHYKRIILWMDPDEAGIEGLVAIRKKVSSKVELGVVLPDGFFEYKDYDKRDPSELDNDEILERLALKVEFTEGLKQQLQLWSSDE